MENAIKPRLREQQIRGLAENMFGRAAGRIEELSDGWANAAYRIELEQETPVVLKAAPVPGTVMMRYEKDMLRTEVQVLRMLEGQLPVPKVYGYDDSRSLIDCEYYFMECLEGLPYNKVKDAMSQEERDSVEYQLGQYNAVINRVKGDRYGPYSASASYGSSWTEAFLKMLEDVLADGEDRRLGLPVAYSDIRAEARKLEDVLDEVKEASLVHWDLWDGNLFIKDGAISGIIDFERALWGDPLMEYYFGRFANSASFLKGYGMERLTAGQAKRRAGYNLYLDLILWIECSYRHYSNPEHEKWAYDNLEHGWKLFKEAVASK